MTIKTAFDSLVYAVGCPPAVYASVSNAVFLSSKPQSAAHSKPQSIVSHNSNFDFIDKGYNVKPNITIEELRIYGMSRLNRGEIKGWYVETDGGEVIEKHTHVIC